MPSRASDMAQKGLTILSAKAANGEVVHINDHVYVCMPWSDRDGSPYIIARILEFVSAGNAHKKGTNSRHVAKNELHVRLSLYYRISDISGRSVSDFRQLLAAIHTIVEPISVIRGKCYVRHKEKIDDLIKWKHTPDHFYFVKFFDPYIKREYEVLRTASVKNIPPNVKQVLLERYEYLLTEKEMVSDLLDDYHSCIVCDKWAASQDAIRCELCRNFYHMQCLNPPMASKPAKGYSWACLTCTIQRRRDVESEKYRYVSNGGSAPPRVKANKKERAAISDTPDVQFRGWPWRYFGLHTRAEDTLSEEDLIFPRAVTRVGPKFTANVLTWEEQQAAEANLREMGPSVLRPERGFDPEENRHTAMPLTVLSLPDDGLAPFMDEVAALNLPVPPYDINRLNKAVNAYHTMGPVAGLEHMKSLRLEDYDNPLIWTAEEDEILESELSKYGGLDAHAISKAVNKRPAEVVRYTFKWRNKRLKTENDLIRQHRKVHAAHGRNNSKTLGPPSLGKIRSRADSELSEDEGSLYNAAFVSTNRMVCAACGTRNSNVWWKCPRTVAGNAMCEPCGSNYRKYGVISFVKSDDAKLAKKEPRRRKGAGAESGSAASTPAPAAPRVPPCACCRKLEPKAQLARCKTCTFAAHSGCYGIPPGFGVDWECELCANVRDPESNLEPACVLCPADTTILQKSIKRKPTGDFDLLSALKPTEGCRWAHVLCAAWHPEIVYADGGSMKKVEGISTIPDERWAGLCTLCHQGDGAKLPCAECGVLYHASCAYLAGHKVAFELTLAKPRAAATIVRFKDDAGIMAPTIYCRSHSLEGRKMVEPFEMDPEAGENALQTYVGAYKVVKGEFALLRKAKRLDQLEGEKLATVAHERMCSRCGTDVSPRWHGDVCHLCWFETREHKPMVVDEKPQVNGLVHAAA